MSESGKTTLAKILANGLVARGKKIAVLDPLADPEWHADFIARNAEDFLEGLRKLRGYYVFVDESGTHFNDGRDTSYSWLTTTSRHWGHSVFLIGHRSMQIPRTMRDQVSRLFLFASSKEDGDLLATEWNQPGLTACNKLPRFHFFSASKFSPLQEMKIVNFKEIHNVSGGRNRASRAVRNPARDRIPSGEMDKNSGV